MILVYSHERRSRSKIDEIIDGMFRLVDFQPDALELLAISEAQYLFKR